MKIGTRITCLLLALPVVGYLFLAPVQTSHALEEASFHARAAASPAASATSSTDVHSDQPRVHGTHVCHSCLATNPNSSIQFELARQWTARLTPTLSWDSFQTNFGTSPQVTCPNRRAPPAFYAA